MAKKPTKLTPAQVEALDRDKNGEAGGSLPQHEPEVVAAEAEPEKAEEPKGETDLPPTEEQLENSTLFEAAKTATDPAEPSNTQLIRVTPYVGALVHFFVNEDAHPSAAIVSGMNGDSVHVSVFKPGALNLMSWLDVPHKDDRERGDIAFWDWIPR